MPYNIYIYKHTNETTPFLDWSNKLQKAQLAKLENKLDALYLNGEELRPEVLAGTKEAGIFKIKVKGNVQLRPLLCRSPDNSGYVFLLGAVEKDFEFVPKDALKLAVDYRAILLSDFEARSVKHERYI